MSPQGAFIKKPVRNNHQLQSKNEDKIIFSEEIVFNSRAYLNMCNVCIDIRKVNYHEILKKYADKNILIIYILCIANLINTIKRLSAMSKDFFLDPDDPMQKDALPCNRQKIPQK